MPISEDEFDSRQGYDEDQPQPKGLSKAELRKVIIINCVFIKS